MAGSIKLDNLTIQWFGHSTVALYGQKIIFIDPFSPVLENNEIKADLIISSHDHRDHFDPDAINSLLKQDSQVVLRPGCDLKKLRTDHIFEMEIYTELELQGAKIFSVPAYNINRFRSPGVPFHPEGFGMGVVITFQGKKFYYPGDTDFIDSMKALKNEEIDLAFVPIGGTFTMDSDEAAKAIKEIAPKQAFPIHYNFLPKTEADPQDFKNIVEAQTMTSVIIL